MEMGHCIRAIIGTYQSIQKLANDWVYAKEIELPQGYGMIFLTDELAYVETDYFGGIGTQGGVLYENGRIRIAPHSGDGTINLLLRELGVKCLANKDEFDSLNLGNYRHMTEY